MNWKQWLKYSPYKKIWFWADRPFTYILRDFYHKFEYLIIIGFFSLGYFIRPYLTIEEFRIAVISGTICFILGHIFWGTKWIEGQQGE